VLELLAVAAEHGTEQAEASAFGIQPGGYVALSMLVVIGIMLYAGVPKLIAKGLDARIAGIRQQLDEAKRLRAEAEALKEDYARKAAEADSEIAGLKAAAERQATEIVAKAKADAEALIARHQAMAEAKIAAAERAAIDELRAKTAEAAAFAARHLIAAQHNEASDRKLVDEAISKI
jgi:F-type H+-transporting ATPase subunit b